MPARKIFRGRHRWFHKIHAQNPPAATPRRFSRLGQRPMVHHPQVAFEPNYMQHLVPIHRRNVTHPATPASGTTLKRRNLAPWTIHLNAHV